jgi:hypothetical protein
MKEQTQKNDRQANGLLIGFLVIILCIAAIPATVTSLTTYDSVAEMAANHNPAGLFKSAYARGYYARGDGGGGMFVVTNSVTSTNLGGRIFALLGGGTYSFDAVGPDVSNVRRWGAKGDGSFDDTASVVSRYNALPSTKGGEIVFPGDGEWKYNLVITNSNIQIVGQSHYVDGYAGTTSLRSRHIPADITKPVIQIGDDTAYARGVSIQGCTFYGGHTGSMGIYFAGGAFENSMQNCTVSFFTTCIKVQGGTSLPASIIHLNNVWGQPANVTGARGLYFVNTANYPTSWTTEIVMNGGHWNGPSSGSNNYAMEVDSCEVKIVDVYFDTSDARGWKISHNLTPLPWIDAINSNVDSGLNTRVAIEGYNNVRIFAGLATLNCQINGKYKELDGTLMTPPPTHLRQNTLLVYPSIFGAISLTDPTDAAWLGGTYDKYQIYAGTQAIYFDTRNGLGQIHCYLGNGLFEIHNKNPTPDGNTYLRFTDDLNGKKADIHSLLGFIDMRPTNGAATRFQNLAGNNWGQFNATDGAFFLFGAGISSNMGGIYIDGNGQVKSGSLPQFVQTAAGTVANTVTETTIIGTVSGPGKTLSANRLVAGKNFKGRFRGRYSTTGTPTLQIKAKMGSTVLLDTGAITLGSGVSNKYLDLDFDVTCRTTGASGTVFAMGTATFDTTIVPLVNTATATIDTTASQVVDVTATWGTANAANTVTGSTGVFNEGF